MEMVVIILAGFAAGLVNVVAGAGTLITFPTLLALGVAPVTANMSSSIGLIPGSLSGVWGYRQDLRPHSRSLVRLGLFSAAGAVSGGILLIVLPPEFFSMVVPYLLLASAILAGVQPIIRKRVRSKESIENKHPEHNLGLGTAVFLTGIYGGYFGAAQGVLLLAVLGTLWAGSLNEANGVKNALVAIANILSALVFIFSGAVSWGIAILVGIGALAGGFVGARVSRWLPAPILRAILVAIALIAAVVLFLS